MPPASSSWWWVMLVLVAAGLAGCAVVESDPSASPPPIEQPSVSTIPPPVIAAGGATDADAAMRRRCIDAVVIFEQRIDREGFEFPEELDELSDEELERLLTPGFDVEDGVAAPGDRPAIEPMPAFDPRTAPMLALDQMVGACFELGIVTDADVYGAEEADPEEASARD